MTMYTLYLTAIEITCGPWFKKEVKNCVPNQSIDKHSPIKIDIVFLPGIFVFSTHISFICGNGHLVKSEKPTGP